MVDSISSLVHPTLVLESDPCVIEPISSLVNFTLPSKTAFHKAIESIPYSIDPTLPLHSKLYTSHIFFTSSSKLTKLGGTQLISDEPPTKLSNCFLDWDSLFEPRHPFNVPFQIKVKVEPYTISHCILDKGASVSIYLHVLGKACDL